MVLLCMLIFSLKKMFFIYAITAFEANGRTFSHFIIICFYFILLFLLLHFNVTSFKRVFFINIKSNLLFSARFSFQLLLSIICCFALDLDVIHVAVYAKSLLRVSFSFSSLLQIYMNIDLCFENHDH